MAREGDGNGGGGKGTEFGFPQLTPDGKQVEPQAPRSDAGRAVLPPPRGRPASQLRIPVEPEPEPEAATAAVLRRVEHELAEPARFTAATQTGRELMRDQIEGGLKPVKSEELIKHDLLAAEQPPAWQRVVTALTWTRGRLVGVIAAAVALVAGVTLLLVLRCSGGSTEQTELSSTTVPPAGEPAAPKATGPKATGPKATGPKATGAPPEAAAPADSPEQARARARKQIAKGFCPDAAQALTALLGRRPDDAAARLLLGRALVCQGRNAAGLEAYTKALAGDVKLGADKGLLEDLGFLLTDKAHRRRAARLAATIGKPAAELLLGAATNRDAEVRRTAVAALVRIGTAAKVDWHTSLWLDLEQSPCPERPAVIDRIVARIDKRRAAKLLRAALRSAGQACVREQLQAALARLK